MFKENKFVFNGGKIDLPENYKLKLNDVVKTAIEVFSENLKSIILGGSGGKSDIIPNWSDLDVYIILDYYDIMQVSKFSTVDEKNDKSSVHIGVTIYTLQEVEQNLIDGKTKVMVYEKEKMGVDPTLYGKNFFLKQKYADIQANDLINLPNILHECRRNCVYIMNNETSLQKKHIKKLIVLLKCILNINGVFSYGYKKVMIDFYNLCEEKKLIDVSMFQFKIERILNLSELSDVKSEFIDFNNFIFKNIPKLLDIKIENNRNKIISCMGIVACVKKAEIYVAILKDNDNCWVLPKGHFEKNENFVETAIREVGEETGIKINFKNFIDKVGEYKYFSDIDNNEKFIKIYLFKIDKMQIIIPQAEENFIDGKWVLLEEAINMVYYQEQKNALNKVRHMLKK